MRVFLDSAYKVRKIHPNETNMKSETITLQIPLNEYGKISTLAAAAGMPLDKYLKSSLLETPQKEPA